MCNQPWLVLAGEIANSLCLISQKVVEHTPAPQTYTSTAHHPPYNEPVKNRLSASTSDLWLFIFFCLPLVHARSALHPLLCDTLTEISSTVWGSQLPRWSAPPLQWTAWGRSAYTRLQLKVSANRAEDKLLPVITHAAISTLRGTLKKWSPLKNFKVKFTH